MKENTFRKLLSESRPSVATRIWSTWPVMIEACASTGNFDYIEFVAEYAPFTQYDLENIARACEVSGISSMIKVDFQNRFYVAQRAMAAGFQSVLFTDHKTAKEVEESLFAVNPDCPEYGGRFGYPNNRWVGYQPHNAQMAYAKMVKETVKAFMVEKEETMANLEEICAVPGVDMVQFGPSDYCMSRGWDVKDHREDVKKTEERMIQIALDHGVAPRCELDTLEKAEYYKSLGVKHFCVGDEFRNQMAYWNGPCKAVKDLAATL
ncbi:MAG: HpcH/HpaI aldolase/citrate lyase family protein [Oscillospiraceae bacterium]